MGTISGFSNEQDAVVLIDYAGGRELQSLKQTLSGPWDIPTVLLGGADLAATSLSLDVRTGLLDVDGRLLRPAVVWVRHVSACAIVAQAQPAGSVTPLAATSWSTMLQQLAGREAFALPGAAPTGPVQLLDAERLGISTPRTVITTDVAAGARQMRTPRIIVKIPDFRLYEPDRQNWAACLPRIIQRDAALGEPASTTGPVVVQEYHSHARELRVFYLDQGICAFEVHKAEPASMWTDPDSVIVCKVACPQVVADAVRTLSTAWRLRFGAFDLLISDNGEPVFLEVNPDGDWLWYERKARWHGVSFMAAVMVRQLFLSRTAGGIVKNDCIGG